MAAILSRRSPTKLFPLWAGLLVLGGFAPAFGAAQQQASHLRVHVQDGLVSLSAQNMPVQDVLREIAVQSDLRLVQHVILDRVMSLSVVRQPLPDVLDLVLKYDSYQLFQRVASDDEAASDQAIPGALWVFSEGSELAPAATILLETVIYHGTVGEKKEAIRELRRIATPDAVRTLSVALGDQDPRVQKTAMEALSRIGGDEALAAIASASMDADPRVRGKAADAMAMAGGYSSTEYLKIALQDEDPRVRASVIDSLGDIGDDYSMQVIQRALQDPDLEVRERALEVLDELDSDAAFNVLFTPE